MRFGWFTRNPAGTDEKQKVPFISAPRLLPPPPHARPQTHAARDGIGRGRVGGVLPAALVYDAVECLDRIGGLDDPRERLAFTTRKMSTCSAWRCVTTPRTWPARRRRATRERGGGRFARRRR